MIEQNLSQEAESNRIKIIQPTPEDWQCLRDIKIDSLLKEPIAFEDQELGLRRYRNRTEAEWRNKLNVEKSSIIPVFAMGGQKCVGIVNGLMRADHSAIVEHMYVDADYRGQKISRQLLETLHEKLKERGIKTAELEVVETQTNARHLYENLGYKKVGERNDMRGDLEVVEIIMVKEL